jgi:hypothetical protein
MTTKRKKTKADPAKYKITVIVDATQVKGVEAKIKTAVSDLTPIVGRIAGSDEKHLVDAWSELMDATADAESVMNTLKSVGKSVEYAIGQLREVQRGRKRYLSRVPERG